MNPTYRARVAFAVTFFALLTMLVVIASSLAPPSSAPSLGEPSLQAVGPASASAAPSQNVRERPTASTALGTPPIVVASQPAAVPARVDTLGLDSTPAIPVAPAENAPHPHPVAIEASTVTWAVPAGDAEQAEVSNTAVDDQPASVEITVSQLPDPPDVAASHATETVEVPVPQVLADDPWQAVRECESRGDYAINTGNGFYGAYQFTVSSWNWVTGRIGRQDLVGVRPDRAAPADQDTVAQALAFEVSGGGLRHWPVCGRRYGT